MRHIHFVSFATVAALLGTFACGSDSSGGSNPGTGGTASGGTAGSGTGGATGGTAGAGTGGAATGGVAGTPGTGGVAGTPGTGGATGGTGGGATGACTNNAPDLAIVNDPNSMVEQKVGDCATQNFGAEPGTSNCIKQQTGLSDPCVACFAGTVSCAVQNCFAVCIAGQDSPDCIACRAQFCDGPFETCSGLTVD